MGRLTKERQQLVKNKHLIQLARRLELNQFLIRKMNVDFSEDSTCRVLSNCMEAIVGAVFLDGGLEEVDRLFARLAFAEEVRQTGQGCSRGIRTWL